jgi:5-methylcytosine-specific restriction endonuclease McrA
VQKILTNCKREFKISEINYYFMKKTCNKCNELKGLSLFNKGQGKHKRHSTCKECLSKINKEKRALKPKVPRKKRPLNTETLSYRLKNDSVLRYAYSVMVGSKTRAKAFGFTQKDHINELDFTVFDLSDWVKNATHCKTCSVELYNGKNAITKIGGHYNSEWITNEINVDHIIPICIGGKLKKDNLQIICALCNKKKRTEEYKEMKKWRIRRFSWGTEKDVNEFYESLEAGKRFCFTKQSAYPEYKEYDYLVTLAKHSQKWGLITYEEFDRLEFEVQMALGLFKE